MNLICRYVVRLPPRTKKNSQEIRFRDPRRRTQPYIAPSEAFKEYQHNCYPFLIPRPPAPISRRVQVVCRFYRDTMRRMDLTNAEEAIDDILVHYGILADDNCNVLVSHDGSRVLYDKDDPRTEIEIYALEDNET